jgi:hypothetical protein
MGESRFVLEGRSCPARFDDHPRITQATIVENKRLGAALAVIQAAQIERDRMRLDSKKLTVREKTRIRAGWAEAAPELDLTRSVPKRTSLLCLDICERASVKAEWRLKRLPAAGPGKRRPSGRRSGSSRSGSAVFARRLISASLDSAGFRRGRGRLAAGGRALGRWLCLRHGLVRGGAQAALSAVGDARWVALLGRHHGWPGFQFLVL